MNTTRKHYVTFFSPGTLFAETTTKPIAEWDTREAASMAQSIRERYGATPYSFRFETRIVAEDVPDGEGGSMKVEPKTIKTSGMHYICGVVETLEQVKARATERDRTLVSNMENSNITLLVTTRNGYTSSHEFEPGDCVVDADGTVTRCAEAP